MTAAGGQKPGIEKPENMDAALVLDDGSIFWGKGAGAKTTATGELCFNTSMTGYQEILTDPSYAGQIITFTFPHIGIPGTNLDDVETLFPAVRGCVMAADISSPSNWRAVKNFDDWLKSMNLAAITGVDTRLLTGRLRDKGYSNATLVNGAVDIEVALEQAINFKGITGMDLAKEVTCEAPYKWNEDIWSIERGYKKLTNTSPHVVAMDFGAKRNILRCLANAGCAVTVVPANTPAAHILDLKPDGIFLSNGPGDPVATGAYAVQIIKELIDSNLPIFGICLGHQLLAITLGAKTKKMHHGHRGANHPVKNLETKKIEITSQNHGFVVLSDTLPDGVVETHRSLFDNTVEGIKVKDRPIFSVQYHPEASPGPQDSHYLFDTFVQKMRN